MRYTRNDRTEARSAIFGEVNGVVPTGNFLFRKNDGVTDDHVYTISSNIAARTSAPAGSGSRSRTSGSTKGCSTRRRSASRRASLATSAARSTSRCFDFDTLSDIGDNLAGNDDAQHLFVPADATRASWAGTRCARATTCGSTSEFGANPGRAAGDYIVPQRRPFTRQQDNSTSQFVAGRRQFPARACRPADRSTATATRLNSTWYHGVFVQDDWRVSNKLTVNLGLRYEYEGATTDSENSNVRGFDPTAIAQHHERRAKRPTRPARFRRCRRRRSTCAAGCCSRPTASAASGTPTGTTSSRASGFAYQLNDKTVLRGGIGVYTVPFIICRHLPAGLLADHAARADARTAG